MDNKMKIYIGSDHRGFKLKEELKVWLGGLRYEVIDKGNTILDPEDDFPDFANATAEAVANDPKSVGILMCGSGSGMALAANKHKGVYAVVASDEDALYTNGGWGINLLAFPADKTTLDHAQKVILNWFNNQAKIKESYQRRLGKIIATENKNFR